MAQILIVEADVEHSHSIAKLLRDAGHGAQAIHCGEDAVRAARREPGPELILLSLRLGTTDGFETLRQLRSAGCASPIVILSGAGSVQHAVRAMKLGASDFVTSDASTLLDSVERLLSTRARLGGDAPVLVGAASQYLQGAGAGAPVRAAGHQHAPPRRDRHRQGAHRPRDSPGEPPRAIAGSCRWTARPWRRA